ncbi:MAG: AAA family ATPase [Oceanipulchritudo sp.]
MSLERNAYQRCQAFIDSNFVQTRPESRREPLAVTMSREVYSQSHEIAEKLITLLQSDSRLGRDKWALFDRDLVQKVLEDHNLPKALARYMPEDKDHDFTGVINEILGLHPSLWELFHHTCDTIYKLAKVGNVVLIGRGANIITRRMPHVLHVRLIAPFEERVRRAAAQRGISDHEARRFIRHDDQARAAFVRSHFDEDPEDPGAYHILLNTGKITPSQAAHMIHAALKQHRVDKPANRAVLMR